MIERFDRSFRVEVLDAHLFTSLHVVHDMTDTWLTVYPDAGRRSTSYVLDEPVSGPT